ncbi:unnamed protein product [Microthlaspi erraticum]|uniref:Arabidopsis retrotransposon Orf1 C-terminal domain-containing protein n=1 Tax=Microthlaspi erraticum TaxID=1685480 RepID=A0A6D2K9T9_9BRAS|nr:unnamed protein product [Microthlaspi erraticum]
MDHFLQGREEDVTFRQLGDLFGFTMEREPWNIKEEELQRVWATIADGVYSSSRSKAAQIRKPTHHLTHKDGKKIRGDRIAGNLMPLLDSSLLQDKLTTLGKREGSLVLEGSSHQFCAAGVQVDKRRSTPARLDGHQVLQDQPPH